MTTNKTVLAWLEEMKALVNPDEVVFIDGSEEQIESLRAEAVATGELEKLNEELLPDCYLHRTKVNDVARVEGRTFICSREKENAGPTNNWMDPKEAYEMLYGIAKDSYKGRTMYVIPFSMGPIGSPLAKIGVEITDSIYVVLNMVIMTRVGNAVWDALGDSNDWVRGLHSRCDIDEEKRYICQFPEDNTIISVNSGYGGNVLLGKKCFALRIASYQGWKEGWMAEHMLILGIENPKGEVKYVAAAFPSACGKTNLAMMIPPKYLRDKGYKVWTVGDDISWMRIGEAGRLWAINPVNGFFCVAPVPTKSQTTTPLLQPKRAPYLPMLHTTLITTPYGGKAWIKIPLKTLLSGRATPGTAKPQTKRAHIPTAALPRLLKTAPAFLLNLKAKAVFRFRQSSLVVAVQRPHPSYISQRTGKTACL